jgi:peptidoglycan/LPS O-acetylase OafA/YrhL
MHDRKLTLPRAFQNPVAMYAILAMAVGVILFTFVYREDVFRSTLRYSLQGLALIPIFHFAVTRPEALVFQPLNWGFVRRIGVWSYTVYLCHFVIIEALRNNGVAADNIALFFVLAFALSCFWADLVFRIGEKPFHPLRKRLSGPPQAL